MNFSRKGRSGKAQEQTLLQQLHDQARQQLEQKNEQISSLNKELEKAEKKLADTQYLMKAQMSMKPLDASEDNFDELPEENLKEIEEIKAKNDAELQKLIAENEEESEQLEDCYSKQLTEAEKWSEQHAEQIFIEKQTELQNLNSELEALKAKLAESQFSSTKTKFQLLEESKTTSMTNEQKIRYLEGQLGDLTSLMRDEMKTIRAKIDETVASYNIRTSDHQIEIDRYENEIKIRNEKYETHIEALQQQFNSEKLRYEAAINSSENKFNALQRVQKQLERQHEKQLSTTIKDNEKMKTTIYTIKTRDDPNLEFTKTALAQAHTMEQEFQRMEADIKLADEEIKELMMENKDLEAQLAKYARKV